MGKSGFRGVTLKKFIGGLVLGVGIAAAAPVAHGAEGEWAYMKGSPELPAQPGVYGAEGVFDSTYGPGARVNAASWMGADGDFWLFGGYGLGASSSSGLLNDLWKYNADSGEWAYMKGSPGVLDQSGVYGAEGEFDVTYRPEARYGAVTWTDTAGDLWLFGGISNIKDPFHYLNDLWKYDVDLGHWGYMKGSLGTVSPPGVYGAEGVFDKTYKPGARWNAVSWTDAAGNLWLFGGRVQGGAHLFPWIR